MVTGGGVAAAMELPFPTHPRRIGTGKMSAEQTVVRRT
ncbi:hypothetical protein USDA257_c27290 [Sinorhizobium fredii USDA 257]|uniref:Uncharacterized protein n=1 Tax=Sinorhizobium fredii (strain USDA 257) TaxID=1185652 RepID=I3X5Z6_SINF2|nr:hypothetical protein USDA257_c27290 [Sinorhizobium fredii USDA 257]